MNNNEFIDMFERELSEFTGAPFVVLTDSCTNAILLCLKYFKPDTKIISIPQNTYLSVPMSIMHAGYTPSFEHIQWYETYKLANTNIWDCAVGFKKNMYNNEIQCLSFQQKKCINIGKGGAILLNNKKDYEVLKQMAWDGRDMSGIRETILGYHFNMIPDDAARGLLLLNQLTKKRQDDFLLSYSSYVDIHNMRVWSND